MILKILTMASRDILVIKESGGLERGLNLFFDDYEVAEGKKLKSDEPYDYVRLFLEGEEIATLRGEEMELFIEEIDEL